MAISYAAAAQPAVTQPAVTSVVATPKYVDSVGSSSINTPSSVQSDPTITSPTTSETGAPAVRVDTRNQETTRERDNSRPRNYQETKPKDTYYRKEYGWIMSNADVAKEKGIEGQFGAAVTDVNKNISKADTDFQTSLSSGRGAINSAYDTAISSAQKPDFDMVPVKIFNDATLEGTYMVPRSVANQLHTDSFNGQTGHYASAWDKDNKFMSVDVKPVGISTAYGKELHDSMRDIVDQVKEQQINADKAFNASIASANQERAAQISKFDKESNTAYSGQRATWQSQLDYLKQGYGNRVKQGSSQYQQSKKNLNDSVMGMNGGLLETPTNMIRK
jgi:flagellar hook-basal body complex protein FliE